MLRFGHFVGLYGQVTTGRPTALGDRHAIRLVGDTYYCAWRSKDFRYFEKDVPV